MKDSGQQNGELTVILQLFWDLENLFMLVSLYGNCITLSSYTQFQRHCLFCWSLSAEFGSTRRVSEMC